jgi:hypothetical protein
MLSTFIFSTAKNHIHRRLISAYQSPLMKALLIKSTMEISYINAKAFKVFEASI